jgi:hypothetical protein
MAAVKENDAEKKSGRFWIIGKMKIRIDFMTQRIKGCCKVICNGLFERLFYEKILIRGIADKKDL